MTIKRKSLTEEIDDEAILAILNEPVGSPVELTREQAIAVVMAGIGGRPDLPPGTEYVRRLRKAHEGTKERG